GTLRARRMALILPGNDARLPRRNRSRAGRLSRLARAPDETGCAHRLHSMAVAAAIHKILQSAFHPLLKLREDALATLLACHVKALCRDSECPWGRARSLSCA